MNIELNSHIEGFMQEYHGMLPMPNAGIFLTDFMESD